LINLSHNILKIAGFSLGYEHTDITKAKLSETFTGVKNPMFGRTGENHPMFGKKGENNVWEKPFFKSIGEN